MGGQSSKVSDLFVDYKEPWDVGDWHTASKCFSDDAVIHFYNCQDRKPLTFKGKVRIQHFFKLFFSIFPFSEAAYTLGDDTGLSDEEDPKEIEEQTEAGLRPHAITIISSFFDEDTHAAVLCYKYPNRGYRFIQENIVMNSSNSKIMFLSLTMDASTDFTGLEPLE